MVKIRKPYNSFRFDDARRIIISLLYYRGAHIIMTMATVAYCYNDCCTPRGAVFICGKRMTWIRNSNRNRA